MMITEKFYQRMTELAGVMNEAGRIDFLKTKFKEWADELYRQVSSQEKSRIFNPDDKHPEGGTWTEKDIIFPADLVTAFKGKIPTKEKYDSVINKIFQQIIDADPLPNKQNSQWLIKLFTNNLMVLEDLYKATNYLTLYEKVKQAGKIPVEQRDINKFKSLPELYDIISQFEKEEVKSKATIAKEKKLEGATKIFEDSHWLVITPKTEDAACLYGMDTQWCTTSGQFNHYHKQGPLYILFDKSIEANPRKNPNKKLQFHFESRQFMDAQDRSIKIGDFFRKNRQLLDVFDKLGKTTPAFKLEHRLMSKEEALPYLKNQKQRISFLENPTFGAEWIFNYLVELGETEELKKVLFNDPLFLKTLIKKKELGKMEIGLKLLKGADKDMMADFLYNNPVVLEALAKEENPAKDMEEYLRLMIHSGERGKKYAHNMFIETDVLYNIMKKRGKVVDFYNILQKGVFGIKGAEEAINRMFTKNSKYGKDYTDIFGLYSLDVMKSFLHDVHEEIPKKPKKKSLEESFSVDDFKEQFLKEGAEYLTHLGFPPSKKS